MSVSIEEIEMIAEIVLKKLKVSQEKATPEDIKAEFDLKKAEFEEVKKNNSNIKIEIDMSLGLINVSRSGEILLNTNFSDSMGFLSSMSKIYKAFKQ